MIDRNWTEPLPIFAWLIEHPESEILIHLPSHDPQAAARLDARQIVGATPGDG